MEEACEFTPRSVLETPTGTRSCGVLRPPRYGSRCVWFPLVAVLLIYVLVGLVLWAVWEPLTAELKENPLTNVPVITVMLALVLVPPLVWSLALAT